MTVHGRTIYKYVIQENQNKFPEEWLQDLIHKTLECGRSVGQTKRHDPELILSLMGLEGSLVLIFLQHSNLMVAYLHIQFGEHSST